MLNNLTFGFIGGGNLATALIGGLIARGVPAGSIRVADPYAPARERLAQEQRVQTVAEPDAALVGSDVVVLATKPQQFREACAQLLPHLRSTGAKALIVSVAAGIRLADMQRWLDGHARTVRSMPNTPALAGMGMTGLTAPVQLSAEDRAIATSVAEAVGKCLWFDNDAQMDAVTAVSGSGPAYVFYVLEAMEKAALEMGLTAAQGRELAIETFRGAATLAARSSESLTTLRERVTSKGGTTHAALAVLSEAKVDEAVVRALKAAAARGAEMGEEFGRA